MGEAMRQVRSMRFIAAFSWASASLSEPHSAFVHSRSTAAVGGEWVRQQGQAIGLDGFDEARKAVTVRNEEHTCRAARQAL